MTLNVESLRYAVRLRVVAKYVGQFCIILSALTVAPLLVGLLANEMDVMWRYLVVVVALAGGGYGLLRLKAPDGVQTNEAMVVVAMIFLIAPSIAVYPFMGFGLSAEDALFEAISGVTTTGLTTLQYPESRPMTFLFSRAWLQWYGGIGIVVLSLAFMVQPGLAAKGLATAENIEEDLIGGIKAHALRILAVYALLTLLGFCLLWLMGVPAFSALLYTLTSVSTGGFSPHEASLAALDGWPAKAAVIILCLSGALPLLFYHELIYGKRLTATHFAQVGMLAVSCFVVGAILTLINKSSAHPLEGEALLSTILLAFSAQSTAGFATTDVGELTDGAKLVLVAAMFVGGGIGSTAGGIKLFRFLIVLRLFHMLIDRTCIPRHAIWEVRIAGHRLEQPEIRDTLVLVILFLFLVGLSWFPFVVMGYEPVDSLFEVTSASGTVGLSTGITTSELPALLKIVLCADMLLGRLEIVPWLVFAYPRTWFGRRLRES